MVVVPNNVTKFGGLAGKIVVGAQYSLQMYIIDPTNGNVTAYDVPMEIEGFQLIPRKIFLINFFINYIFS